MPIGDVCNWTALELQNMENTKKRCDIHPTVNVNKLTTQSCTHFLSNYLRLRRAGRVMTQFPVKRCGGVAGRLVVSFLWPLDVRKSSRESYVPMWCHHDLRFLVHDDVLTSVLVYWHMTSLLSYKHEYVYVGYGLQARAPQVPWYFARWKKESYPTKKMQESPLWYFWFWSCKLSLVRRWSFSSTEVGSFFQRATNILPSL